MTTELVQPDALAEIEARVQHALATSSTEGLDVIGYGEITLVIGWPAGAPRLAVKRLPPFPSPGACDRYGDLVADYLDRLPARGVEPVDSQWHSTPSVGGQVAGFVVQPILDRADLAVPTAKRDDVEGARIVAEILARIPSAVDRAVGLDAQLSNWAEVDGDLRYLDVTTPLLTDGAGRPLLEVAQLTSPLPALLRPAVRRFVAPGILATYHRPRDVAVDLIGNLVKERLSHLVGGALDEANRWADPAISTGEIDRWYRSNARLWELMLRLRRADARWQRTIRRRPPRFMLPGPIER